MTYIQNPFALSSLKAILDPDMRARRLAHSACADPAGAIAALSEWVKAARAAPHTDPVIGIDAILLTLLNREAIPYDTRAELHAAAQDQGLPQLGLLLFDPTRAIEDDVKLRDEVEAPSQPTLGARKAVAALPNRDRLERLLVDPHPQVVEKLLANPRLTERDVVAMAARRPTLPECQQLVFQSRFRTHHRVRRALALNPFTAIPLVAGLALTLPKPDLRTLANDRRQPSWLRLHARWLLEL